MVLPRAERETPEGSIEDLLTRLLDRGYNGTAGRVVGAIGESYRSGVIETRLNDLTAEIARLGDERITAQNPVFRALVADIVEVLK